MTLFGAFAADFAFVVLLVVAVGVEIAPIDVFVLVAGEVRMPFALTAAAAVGQQQRWSVHWATLLLRQKTLDVVAAAFAFAYPEPVPVDVGRWDLSWRIGPARGDDAE